MKKIAIDIVLLPSENVMNRCIEINKDIVKNNGDKTILDPINCPPHISTIMSCVNETDLSLISKIVKEIVKEFKPIKFEILGIKENKIQETDESISVFKLKENKEIKSLISKLYSQIKSLISFDASTNMFFSPPFVEEISTSWVRNHENKIKNIDSFKPHITLGIGTTQLKQEPIKFSSSKIAIFQLGNYCTCRKLISEFELK